MKENDILLYIACFTVMIIIMVYLPVQGYYANYLEESQISTSKTRVLEAFEHRLDTLEAELATLYESFLPQEDLIDFGYRLTALCERTGLAATEISYKDAKENDEIKVMPFVFTISGTYRRIRDFLAKAETSFPFMIIDAIDRIASTSSESKVTIRFEGGVLIRK